VDLLLRDVTLSENSRERSRCRGAIDAFEERTGLIKFCGDIARHPVPPDTGWWYVFGSAALVCFIMQVVTGIALATRFVASSGSAYQVLDYITYKAVLGSLLRGTHLFGASVMILLVGIHMIQVFLMGCYKYPREFNWVTGVTLLFLTVAMGFTGQLLRWDQTAVWVTVLAAEMIGRTPKNWQLSRALSTVARRWAARR
jgi:ubiquinol-cytochrome c reductase cytochrome b subunit